MPETTGSFVYFIQETSSKKGQQPTKIGVASDPERRLKELQTGNPRKLKISATIPCDSQEVALKLERSLHFITKKKFKKLQGEWFMVYGSWLKLLDDAVKMSHLEINVSEFKTFK